MFLSACRIIAVKVIHYKAADPIAPRRLRLADDVTQDSFKTVATKPGETGLFSAFSYSYSDSSAGTKLDLELADKTELDAGEI